MSDLAVHRAVLCAMVLVNPSTQNLTFVEIVHALGVPASMLGEYVPFRAHFLLAGEGAFDVRVVWISGGRVLHAGSGWVRDGRVVRAGDACDRVSFKGTQEFVSQGVRLPPEVGEWTLALQWRPACGGDVARTNVPDLDGPNAGWRDGEARHWVVVRTEGAPVGAS